MLRRPSLAAAALTLAFACSKGQEGPTGPGGGGQVCTQIGCVDGLQIELARGGPWPPGVYTFALELDGEAVTCSGALPLAACDAGPSLACDGDGRVVIGESGCALPAAEHGFSDVHVSGAPARVKLTILRDGEPVQRGELTPTYSESRPNGPGCEPVCRGAAARIEIP